MNLQNILSELEKVDGEVFDRLAHVSRRGMFSSLTKKTVSVAAPAIAASLFTKAYGAALPANVAEVFNFALALEYLEWRFYDYGNNLTMIPKEYKEPLEIIRRHELAHVQLLRGALGSAAIPEPKFDFTAGGIFWDVFSNFKTFAAVSQTFEDTGVRAYKGQAGNLQNAPVYLQIALQIHATEAAHAATIRRMREQTPWITGGTAAMQGLPAVVDGNYKGEDNVIQGGLNVVDLLQKAYPMVPHETIINVVTQAFDEPLSKETVLALVKPFFK